MLSKTLFLLNIIIIIIIIIYLLDGNSAILLSSQQHHRKQRSTDFATKNNRRYGAYEIFDIEQNNDVAPKGAIECPPNYTGAYPYLMSCRQFLNCWKGRGTIQMCAPGTLFNAKTLECDYPLKVKCETFDGTYPSSQRQQYQPAAAAAAAATTGHQQVQSRFGADDDDDDRNNNRNYVNTDNNNNKVECRPYTSGLFAHPYDCKKFLNCDRGTTHIQECGPGTVFNPIANVCDWPANVQCPETKNQNQNNNGTHHHQHPHHHHDHDQHPHHHTHHNHNHDHNNHDHHQHHQHHRHHQQQPHNNRNEFPYITTSTVPNSNLFSQYDFPSTTPTTFFYNRDVTPTSSIKHLPSPPLLYDRFGNVGVSCDNGFNCENGLCISYDKVCDGRFNCENRLDEQQCDHIGYEIRLSGEKISTNMGRIEVKVFDKWGYVCDDRFSIIDANVACRELGFSLGASEVRANSYYPPNENMLTNLEHDPIMMMDEVNCLGNETSLRQCKFNGWGVHDCNIEEIVGVVCKVPIMKCPDGFWLCEASEECIPISFLCDTIADCKHGDDENSGMCNAAVEYRLAGSEIDILGRVEVKYHGMWGTICDDDFGTVEASVICRSLGFGGPASLIKSEFGIGTGPIWLDQISCYGNETSIDKCMHFEWGNHNCNHTEDVAVRCTPGDVNPITINNEDLLASESNENEYLVKMQRHSKVLVDETNTCGQIKLSNDENGGGGDDANDYEPGQFRVIGGKRAKRGNHPWQATIRAKDLRGKSAHWCGAVLISNIHLLTAAHCLKGFQKGSLIIRIGDHNSDVYEDTEVEIFIENIYIHEDFRRGQHMNNDIALVLFKSRISFTNYIQPVCLPTVETEYTPGMNCTISGWGSVRYGRSTPSLELLSASLPIISDDVCRQPNIYGDAIMDGMFCAGYLEAEGTDACEGDSGGPLVCENNEGIHVLYGIISWGHRCGDANKPGVYVKISHYLDWIGEQILQSISNT